MRHQKIILLVFSFLNLLIFSNTAYSVKVGYGSSDAVYSAKNQEYFYMGFSFAMERFLEERYKSELSNILVSEQLSDKKQLSAIRAAKKLISSDVVALTGFPTSHEALLVAPLAKENDILFISAAAAHSKISEYGPNVYTLGESVLKSKIELINFIKNKLNNPNQGVLITDKQAVFSVNQSNLLIETNQKSSKPLSFSNLLLNSEKVLSKNNIESIKNGKYDFIILTTYADDSVKFLEQLISYNINIPIIANSSWTIGNIEMVRRLLVKYKGEIFCVSSVVKGIDTAQTFEKSYLESYGKQPETEMYYGYDLGVIVSKVMNSLKGNVTRKDFINTFSEIRCFEGLTTGNVCFPEGGGHVLRQIHWLKFNKLNGFKKVN